MTEIKAKHINNLEELDDLRPGEIVMLSKGEDGIFSECLAIYFGANEKGHYEFLQTSRLDKGIYVDIINERDIRFSDGMILAKESEMGKLFDGENSKYCAARKALMKRGFLDRDYLEGEELREHLRGMGENGFGYYSPKMQDKSLVIIPNQAEPSTLRERIKKGNLSELLGYNLK
ncbi:MAG: hypothetical protein AABW50_03290 [Nanoarchaeota archaeon]